jgi:ATP-dependent Clp protease ATP-binding subunit ClpA
MFERFTPDARSVVTSAQDEARALRHPFIGTEHLVVAMLTRDCLAGRLLQARGMVADPVRERLRTWNRADTELDPAALATLGIDLDAVRRAAEEQFGPGALAADAKPMPRGHLPFTRQSKKVLELAVREAIAADAGEINSGHLLLGIIADADGLGVRVIRDAGVEVDELRAEARRQAAHRAA